VLETIKPAQSRLKLRCCSAAKRGTGVGDMVIGDFGFPNSILILE